MSKALIACIALLAGALLGNLEGDRATLRDCATKGRARMAGGGDIECRVLPSASSNP